MSRTWVAADMHWGHQGMCNFLREDGVTKLRPWEYAEEMDEFMVKVWNETVDPRDRVYVLGDVAMAKRQVATMGRCNGRKVLVKGNHDIFDLNTYLPYFDDIRAYVVKKTPQGGKLIMSHIPIHEESIGRFGLNIHGHLHSNIVKDANGNPDKRYVCVSMEHIDYKPLSLEDAIARGVPVDASY